MATLLHRMYTCESETQLWVITGELHITHRTLLSAKDNLLQSHEVNRPWNLKTQVFVWDRFPTHLFSHLLLPSFLSQGGVDKEG